MSSEEERRFSGKVYSRRNHKDVSPATATDVTAPEPKVSENKQPAQVIIPQTDHHLITNSSGYVPKGNVELREGSQCNRSLISRVGDKVRVRLSKSRSLVEIGEAKRVFEGELDEVRVMVKKIEAKEKVQHTSGKHRGLVLKTSRPISFHRYPSYMIDDLKKNRCPNLVRPIDVPNVPFRRPPSVAPIANNGIEREKRTRMPNRYYYSSEFLLEKDKLPSEIYKKSKKNKNETKKKGFAAGLKEGTSGEMRDSSHAEGEREADNDSGSPTTEKYVLVRRAF